MRKLAFVAAIARLSIKLSVVKDLHQPGLTVSPMLVKTSVGSQSPHGNLRKCRKSWIFEHPENTEYFRDIILNYSGLVSEWLPSIARAHFCEWLLGTSAKLNISQSVNGFTPLGGWTFLNELTSKLSTGPA